MKETPKQKKARIREAEELRTELGRLTTFLNGVKSGTLNTNSIVTVKAKKRIEEINSRLAVLNVRLP